MTKKAKALTLANFNTRAAADVPHKLELEYAGEPTGVIVEVIGEQSRKVRDFISTLVAKEQRANPKRKRDLEEVEGQVIEAAMVRTVGWNLVDEFNEENLRTLFEQNPDFVMQVVEASNERLNFTKGLAKS